MLKLLSLFLLFICFWTVQGHNFGNKLLTDADLQSALMPQELNPDIVFDKDAPWRTVFPLDRMRRDVEVVPDVSPLHAPITTVSQNLKVYSRIATCVALVLGGIVEVILYIVEFYQGG